MTVPYAHLNAVARAQAQLGDEERIRSLYGERWIPHPRAQRALDRLNFLFGYPKCARMQGLPLFGDSGIGKTMIVEKFLRDHPRTYDCDAGVTTVAVLAMQMPPAPDEKRFYTQLLNAVGAPAGPDGRNWHQRRAGRRSKRSTNYQPIRTVAYAALERE